MLLKAVEIGTPASPLKQATMLESNLACGPDRVPYSPSSSILVPLPIPALSRYPPLAYPRDPTGLSPIAPFIEARDSLQF